MTTGVKNPTESSGTAFAFIRPLPGAVRTGDGSSHPQVTFTQPSTQSPDLGLLLFPNKQSESDQLLPVTGVVLGHFILEERIGRGGMGAVFRAIDQRLNRVVALKVLTPEQSRDPAAIQRFHNEARAAAQLDDEHIANVHYIGEDQGLHFIAFEFVAGTNVRDVILQCGRLAPHDAVNYTLQIAEALRHTSAQKVVHRDIKPSNIILSAVGKVKLVDLGLARQFRPDQRESEDLTVAGTALGTFDYISPEQAVDARNVDVRSDLYSLGCTLYHMLTGEPPYPRGTMFEKVVNHHRPTPPDPSLKNPNVSSQLVGIVRQMMAANPDDRYQSPEDLIVDLAAEAQRLGMARVSTENYVWGFAPRVSPPRIPVDGTTIWLAILVVLLLGVLILNQSPWTGSIPEGLPSVALTPADRQAQAPSSPTPVVQQPPDVAPEAPAPAASSPVTSDQAPTGFSDALAAQLTRLQGTVASNVQGPAAPENRGLTPPLPALPLAVPDPEKNLLASTASNSANSPGTIMTPSEAVPVPSSVTAPPLAQAPFVLLDDLGNRKEFPTLFAALANAQDNAVIELRFEGRSAGPQDPVRISGKRGIRIRPAGSNRPMLEFRVRPGSSNVLSAARMFTLANSNVELYDIDLELVASTQTVTDQWALFAASGRSGLSLKGCSCTLVNPSPDPSCIIELPQRESADLTQMMKDQMQRPNFTLRLEDCVVRGIGDLVSQHHAHPASMTLQNVAVALSGSMLHVNGADEVAGPPDIEEEVEVFDTFLSHVSAVLGGSFLKASSGDYGRLPVIRIDSRDSLYSLLSSDQAFIELTGHEEIDQLDERLNWVSRREPNYFELLGTMCLISAPESLDFETERRLDFRGWLTRTGESGDELVRSGLFRNPRLGPPGQLDRIEPADFALRPNDVTPNPAVGSTSDRRDCGVDWSLPRIPRDLPTATGR